MWNIVKVEKWRNFHRIPRLDMQWEKLFDGTQRWGRSSILESATPADTIRDLCLLSCCVCLICCCFWVLMMWKKVFYLAGIYCQRSIKNCGCRKSPAKAKRRDETRWDACKSLPAAIQLINQYCFGRPQHSSPKSQRRRWRPRPSHKYAKVSTARTNNTHTHTLG